MSSSGGLRRIILGEPLPSGREGEERLGVLLGLPVFASDAISSVAYASEEILLALVLAGPLALGLSLPITAVIVVVMLLVIVSYQQIIKEHPEGGGAYTVALTHLGRTGGLIAGGALLIDYVLTVAVSVSAGIHNLVSAWPALQTHQVGLCVAAIVVLVWLNLRGVRESAKAVAGPVLLFIATVVGMIILGGVRVAMGRYQPLPMPEMTVSHEMNVWLVLHAFASGCVALTGIEAVSNGVQAFRAPAARNARITLMLLGVILATFFIGITPLAHAYRVVPELGKETVLSLLGRSVYGPNLFYYTLQLSTLVILLLAANTSFAGFPRLASLLARDGFMPRQLSNLGDRLVFSNGIILLGLMAIVLVLVFHGSTHALIPLYAIGVFLSFTLAQAGMLRRWFRAREPGWAVYAVMNGIGATATAVVLVVVTIAKFVSGAWIVTIAIPVLVRMLTRVRYHYDRTAEQLTLEGFLPLPVPGTSLVIVPIAGMHRGAYMAVEYAQSLGAPVEGVHVIADEEAWGQLQERWDEWEAAVPLVGLPSPYRSLLSPLVDYIVEQSEQYEHVTVVIPEFTVSHWWEEMLHNQSALALSLALRKLEGISVVHFRYHLKD